MEEVAATEKFDEPDELGAIRGRGGTDTQAPLAANHARVLMGSNSHDALGSRQPQGLWPARATADEPYE